ncbi:MAG TPA: biotin--[acetyl-CoA-carboxylase] ligase [Beutenbergiaceae bacterium]|nr:biotin--[acetyl-CoA-carboxylase] ligase [Beutenbergiaceae bacterium]
MNSEVRWHVVDRAGSTNADLAAHAVADPAAWPHLSALLAREQTAGKGRAGRGWDTTNVAALTFSMLLRPTLDRDRWGWLPLLTGLAVVRAIRAQVRAAAGASAIGDGRTDARASTDGPAGADARPAADGHTSTDRAADVLLKWPNDVVVRSRESREEPGWGADRKLGGILAEVLTDGAGVVVGTGLNLDGGPLPVPWATTLAAEGLIAAGDSTPYARADGLAGAIEVELLEVFGRLDDGQDPRLLVEPVCATLGQQVRVDLPGDQHCTGLARALDPYGGLVLQTPGAERTIYAGDVRHLRPVAGS